ncbi:hypothetical protein LCGC14_3074510, partial [marine sediment metagenome]
RGRPGQGRQGGLFLRRLIVRSPSHELPRYGGLMRGRVCTKCQKTKPESEYYLNRGRPRSACKKCWRKKNRTFYEKNKEDCVRKAVERKQHDPERAAAASRRSRRKLKVAVLRAYGGANPRCTCCGEGNVAFLVIDHIGGGGNAHRREISKGSTTSSGGKMYRWLRSNGYPAGFQILCHNCNFAKSAYGECPHVDTTIFEKVLGISV